LEATRDYLGIDPNDLLCTYVCKHCGNWHVAPYKGEDINCPICGAEKKCITVNIKNGVPTQEMKYIYGMCDGGISAFSSGGQELHSSQTMLCGLPLACTNYSCGTDFCTEETKDFVFPISYHHYHEHGTNYIKAASDPSSIADFMRFVCKESKENLKKIGKLSREWAYNQFSIDIIGPKWEAYFDSLPIIDWDKINLEKEELKNPNYPMPFFAAKEDGKYVVALYKNILNMEVDERDGGFQNWMGQLANKKMSRKDVYDYFIKVAKQENDKILNPKEQKVNFESILDKTGNKRAIIVMKESIGDLVILSSVFASFKDRYQNTDLYLATSPKYFDILKGNPHIHKFIPYMPEMESELWCTGQGSHLGFFDYYLNPAIFTQRQLNYLTQKSPVFTVAKD
jgi:hypothetical protein